ncbi:hypothetical protein N7467_007246 [Penicillium canescens]|nr:hypothetical protein N7467_007246 [Penicillium canescens]
MADLKTQFLHDFAILAIIKVFWLVYFYLFVIHFLLFHFLSTPEVFWTPCLFYRFLDAFGGNDAAEWQKLEFGATLVLTWAATLPSVVVLFRTEPCLQLGYLAAFTVVAVGILVDFVVSDPSVCAVQCRFPYSCVSLGLLSLILTIYALTGTLQSQPILAVHFGRIAIGNPFGAALYLLRPLERIGVLNGWRPSLYVMHLVLTYNAVTYSRIFLAAVLQNAA